LHKKKVRGETFRKKKKEEQKKIEGVRTVPGAVSKCQKVRDWLDGKDPKKLVKNRPRQKNQKSRIMNNRKEKEEKKEVKFQAAETGDDERKGPAKTGPWTRKIKDGRGG